MARRKVTIQARELSDMDVSFISLVKRGANRIPFRITKSTGDKNMNMLDVSNLFLKKTEKPVVVGLVLAKGQNAELYSAAMTNQELPIDHVVKQDDSTILMVCKSDLDTMDNVSILKINDEAAVLVTGVKKGIENYPNTQDFDENITKSAFFPSYYMATDILNSTLINIVFSEGDIAVTKSAITKALDDYTMYLTGVLDSVPVEAFKAEEAIVATQKGMLINEGGDKGGDEEAADATADAETTDATADTGTEEEGKDAADAEGGDTAPADDATADAAAAADTGADEAGKDAADAEAGSEEAEVTKAGEADDAISKQLAGIVASLGELTTNVSALKTDVAGVKEDFNSKVSDLESSIKKTDEALNGTVHSDVSEDDANTDVTTQKSNAGDPNWDNVLDFGEGVEQA